MTEGVWVQLITTVGLIVVAWLGNRKLNRIGTDAAQAREQTVNNHAGAEFPNLRDEITAVHATARETAAAVKGLTEITRGHDRRFEYIERNLEDLHNSDGQIEKLVGRRAEETARELAAVDLTITGVRRDLDTLKGV